MKTIATIIVTLSVCLSACVKKQENNKLPLQYPNINTLSVELTPANPLNPYDSIGYWHNYFLANIQPCTAAFSPLTADDINGCIIKIAAQQHVDESGTPFSLVPSIVQDSQNNFKNIIDKSSCSYAAKLLLDSLVDTVKYIARKTNGDYRAIKSVISAFELPILNNNQLSQEDRRTVLSVTSVARYSIFYWTQVVPPVQGLSLKRIVMVIGTAMTDAVSLVVYRSAGFAADSSEEAWWEMTYEIPGDM